MKGFRLIMTGSIVLVAALVLLAWPFYQFYAHRDALPLGPLGWQRLPHAAPASQVLHDAAYADDAGQALALLERHRKRLQTPALAAAVAIGGELVWAGAVGWADIAARVQATPSTRFRIGSTSKALTATALARLVQQGSVALDTGIGAYIDPLPNPQWTPITPRQLASHTSGMPHYKENTDWIGLYHTVALDRHFERVTGAIALFDDSDLLFEPGTNFHYSTLGTVLLGAVMAEATGTSYRAVMREQVFAPNAMSDTIVAPPSAERARDMSVSYKHSEASFRPWRAVDLSHRLPGGGFAATPSDLAKLGAAWLDSDYIRPATRERFWTPQTLASGKVNPQDYCLGWRVREYQVDGHGLVFNANHGGVSRGAMSWLLVFPDYDMALAFNTNSRTKTGQFHHFAMPTWRDLFKAFAPKPPNAHP